MTTPGPSSAKESVRYGALVAQVEQLTGGSFTHGSARRLSDRGWGLLPSAEESVAFLRQVAQVFVDCTADVRAHVADCFQRPPSICYNGIVCLHGGSAYVDTGEIG